MGRRPTLSLPIHQWPAPLRARFLGVFCAATPAQYPRLTQAFGRWLLAAEAEGEPPEHVTPELVASRTDGLRREMASAMRQVLQGLFPDARVFARTEKAPPRNKREKLLRTIERNAHRFPAGWRDVILPRLHIGADELEDGILVRAWAVGTLDKLLHSLWGFTDYCRGAGLPEEINRTTLRARLAERQALFEAGCVVPATMLREVESLYALAKVAEPDRDWSWMRPTINVFKKIAPLYPSRANGRLVELTALKTLATETGEVALRAHRRTRSHKARITAMAGARTGLAIALLVNSPIRVGSLAGLDLQHSFDPSFTTMFLSANETKDRKRDVRRVPPELRRQLLDYVEHHRAVVAHPGETHLFLSDVGEALTTDALSTSIGDLTERHFKIRVTPHVIRNIIASFIVSEAPNEAGLATTILKHRQPGITETYRANADQIKASRRLGQATESAARAVAKPEARSKPPRRPPPPKRSPPRRRSS